MTISRILVSGTAALALLGTTACVTDPNTGEKKISRTAIGTGLGGTLGYLLGGAIGYAYDGTARPLALALLASGLACLALVLWSEKGRLFGPSDAEMRGR